MLNAILFTFVLTNFVSCADICYNEENLGCFTTNKPFGYTLQRPIALLPARPEKIRTEFILYNPLSQSGTKIDSNDILHFNPEYKTIFIIHGFIHHGYKEWILKMKEELLKVDDFNVISVDWSDGAGLPYTQATANTQVVGREIAKLINALCEKTSTKSEDFHLIGHSLGAHISGYAGYRLKDFYKRNLGRITGLDAAGPYFENTAEVVRLDPTDAIFVDAIHSDGTATLQIGLGLFQSIGHVDFYPNGGKDQPDCPQTSNKLISAIFSGVTLDVEGIEKGVACSHNAAIHYYTDSIGNNKYNAYPCDTEEDFVAGACLKCTNKGCNRMGYWVDSTKDSGRLFLDTKTPTSAGPYDLQNFRVDLYSNDVDGILQTKGLFKIYFVTENHQTETHVLDDSQVTFKKSTKEQRLVSLKRALNEDIKDIYISFDFTGGFIGGLLYWDKWSFEYVEVFKGEAQKIEKFCPYTPIIKSGSTVRFIKC